MLLRCIHWLVHNLNGVSQELACVLVGEIICAAALEHFPLRSAAAKFQVVQVNDQESYQARYDAVLKLQMWVVYEQEDELGDAAEAY